MQKATVSLTQFCEMTGVSKTTARKWRAEGFGPVPFRIGKAKWYYAVDEIHAFLRERANEGEEK